MGGDIRGHTYRGVIVTKQRGLTAPILLTKKTHKKMINYSLYLYSNLVKLYDKNFADLEYDLQFALLPTLYKAFEESIYNDPALGEYEAITNYLTNQYKK